MRTHLVSSTPIFIALVVATACAPAGEETATVDPAALHAAADTLLGESAAAWNAGDLDGFLYWYRRGPTTTYIGSSGLLHGWDAIRARYAPTFEPDAARDSLRFEDLETRPLGPGLGLATARYVLFLGDSITSEGVFTLVLEETAEGWRIVHDHSSAQAN
jgi:ketosteroid isomerase-like protein